MVKIEPEEKNERLFVEKDGKPTMEIIEQDEEGVTYINIKIGDVFYSTTPIWNKEEKEKRERKFNIKEIESSKKEITETKGVGKEKCLWIKGNFTETTKHINLEKPLPFNLYIYSKIENE